MMIKVTSKSEINLSLNSDTMCVLDLTLTCMRENLISFWVPTK